MKRHDETMLWQYAARELDADDAALLEHHLEECVECREGMLEVRQARALLEDSRAPRPAVSWAKVDAGISQLVEARLVQKAKASRVGWQWAAGLACAAALLAVAGASLKQRLDLSRVAPAVIAVATQSGTHVDQATGLSRVGAELSTASDGDLLAAGEVLRTSLGGRAILTLPDDSRIRLGAGTQLALTRAGADDVALTLERGRVAVHASHHPRRGFVVHTEGLSVRVVGTLFTVEQLAGAVEVAVVEGKVRVEPPEGEALFLVPPERVRFEQGGWTPIRGTVTPSQVADFAELSLPPMVEAQGSPRPPPGGSVQVAEVDRPAQTVSPGRNGLLPRLPPKVSAARVRSAPVAKAAPIAHSGALAVMAAQPRADAQEDQAGLKTAEPAADPAEFNAFPQVQVEPAAEPVKPAMDPAEASPKPAEPLPVDLETLFLQRAERGIGRGICERYLQGLQELAGDPSRGERAEKARILRARCFDARIRPDLSEMEYRHYLQAWPTGRYAIEARQAIAE